ncbi:MAG: LacI family transcriptional regulator [Chloroflexi bacterium]|nr:LacI family transcriptional regulator [Chloroflexota bacterium]
MAREAGVSKTAVSFAFNSPDRLAPDTAVRIREIAESLGYRPHPVARMLTQRQTMTIGVLTPQALSVIFSNPFFGAFSEGVALAAERMGYALHFISPLHGSLARAIGRATVDGVVAVGLSKDHPEVEQIRRAGLPIVLVDSTALPEQDWIAVDDEGGARSAAEHLVGLGHREFLVIGVERPHSVSEQDPSGVTARRLDGYRAGLALAGVEVGEDAVVTGAASIEGGKAAFDRAWAEGRRPSAVLAMSDAMAIGVMRAVRDLGLRVPDDVSVVGFDDIDLAPYVDPPLTTIHQPIRQKGEEAVRRLLTIIDHADADRSQEHRLETRLIVRGSTGPAPHLLQEVDRKQD